LERGADPSVIGRGGDREWSPLKVARYHRVDGGIIQLLKEKAKAKVTAEKGEDAWDAAFHASGKAVELTANCACCLSVGFLILSPPILYISITIPSIPLSTTFTNIGLKRSFMASATSVRPA